MVQLVKHDLEFILYQHIKIAEAPSAGTPLTQIRFDTQGNGTSDPGVLGNPIAPEPVFAPVSDHRPKRGFDNETA